MNVSVYQNGRNVWVRFADRSVRFRMRREEVAREKARELREIFELLVAAQEDAIQDALQDVLVSVLDHRAGSAVRTSAASRPQLEEDVAVSEDLEDEEGDYPFNNDPYGDDEPF